MSHLPVGLYDRLLDEELSQLLADNSDLKQMLRAIDDESAPQTYSQFVAKIVEKAVRIVAKEERIPLINL